MNYITSTQAAKLIKCHVTTIGKWANNGRLPFIMIGNSRAFLPSDVKRAKIASRKAAKNKTIRTKKKDTLPVDIDSVSLAGRVNVEQQIQTNRRPIFWTSGDGSMMKKLDEFNYNR